MFDDIHWAEPTLLDVIEHVAAWSRDVPILIVCMARPELLEEHPGWGGGQRNATSVHLEPLSEPEADALIENLLGHPALTHEIRERIRAAASGNPLFVEEMLSMLADDAVLVQKDAGWVATVDLSTVQVPPAISALLSSRLDRLSPEERRVVEAAAVVGEVFDRSAVAALVPDESDAHLHERLGRLLLKDVVRPSPSDAGGGWGLRFRHILLRDAAYDAIPKAERAALHEAFADHLQSAFGERTSEVDEFIGYHLEQAHRMRADLGLHDEHTERLARSAFEHLRAAGVRAAERGDPPTAVSLLRHAIDLRDPDDPERLEIAWVLGFALADAGSIPDARALLTDAIARVGIGRERTRGCVRSMRHGDGPAAGQPGGEGRDDRRAGRASDRRLRGRRGRSGSGPGLVGDRVRTVVRGARRGGTQVGRARDRPCASGRRSRDGGRAPQPHERVQRPRADRAARGDRSERGDPGRSPSDRKPPPRIVGRAQRRNHVFDERLLRAGALADRGRSCAGTRARVADRLLGGRAERWSQRMARGRPGGGRGILRESCEALESLGESAFLSTHSTMLAELEVERGNLREADRWIEVAERTGSPDDRPTQVGIQKARGLVLQARGDPSAEAHLRRALALIDETDMAPWRIDTRIALARWVESRDPAEAMQLRREAIGLAESKGDSLRRSRPRPLEGRRPVLGGATAGRRCSPRRP